MVFGLLQCLLFEYLLRYSNEYSITSNYLLAAALENSLGSIEYVMQFEASVTRDAEIVCKLCLILRLKMNGVVLLSTEAELYVQALQAFDIREIGSAR